MPLKTLFIAICLTVASTAFAGENCTVCHRVTVEGEHAGLPCLSCHEEGTTWLRAATDAGSAAKGCTRCHTGYSALFSHGMTTRQNEKQFVDRSWGRADSHFFDKNCTGCHVTGCLDCHGPGGHTISRPADGLCNACHKGYFVGSDYRGMAPREDHMRYQRGMEVNGETFLKMLPDVHFAAGMQCRDCHTMKSLVAGRKSGKGCRDCHKPSDTVIEHRIAAHREKLECYACHSAWASQEYGTFYLRFTDSPSRERYDLRGSDGEYLKSAYLKKQDAPPLGLNDVGRVSPIRPQFLAFYTAIDHDRPVGGENRLLAAEWKAFFPHTIRRGTIMCDGCHDNPRRFLLEAPDRRIHDLRKDGLPLDSFWNRSGQRVVNGGFLPAQRFEKMTTKTREYTKGYVERWKKLVQPGDNSSRP